MTDIAIHFVDPTIPGLSGRDLVAKAVEAARASAARIGGRVLPSHRDHLVRRDLAGLDRELLRDLGIDQGAA